MVVVWPGEILELALTSVLALREGPAAWGRVDVLVVAPCVGCLGCWALAWVLVGVMVVVICGGLRSVVELGGNRWCLVGVSAAFGWRAPWLWWLCWVEGLLCRVPLALACCRLLGGLRMGWPC